jgi:hypothetical protein
MDHAHIRGLATDTSSVRRGDAYTLATFRRKNEAPFLGDFLAVLGFAARWYLIWWRKTLPRCKFSRRRLDELDAALRPYYLTSSKDKLLNQLERAAASMVQGSLSESTRQCGDPTCACAHDPASRHGPHLYFRYKDAGKVYSVYVPAGLGESLRSAQEAWHERASLRRKSGRSGKSGCVRLINCLPTGRSCRLSTRPSLIVGPKAVREVDPARRLTWC